MLLKKKPILCFSPFLFLFTSFTSLFLPLLSHLLLTFTCLSTVHTISPQSYIIDLHALMWDYAPVNSSGCQLQHPYGGGCVGFFCLKESSRCESTATVVIGCDCFRVTKFLFHDPLPITNLLLYWNSITRTSSPCLYSLRLQAENCYMVMQPSICIHKYISMLTLFLYPILSQLLMLTLVRA
jgi:hypothetical protein